MIGQLTMKKNEFLNIHYLLIKINERNKKITHRDTQITDLS